jgi:hypothetical protein
LAPDTPVDLDDDLDQTIEMDDDYARSSTYTQSQYTESRRSSIDSAIYNVPTPPLQQMQRSNNRMPLHRLSTGMYRSPAHNQKNASEHLLLGYAQVIGQFVYDPVLLNSNGFAPLKSKAMYHPFGSSLIIGGGGGMMPVPSNPSFHKKGI